MRGTQARDHVDRGSAVRNGILSLDPSERAYYVVFVPADASLAELAGVAGLRWTLETCFATAKMNSASITVRPAPGTLGTAI